MGFVFDVWQPRGKSSACALQILHTTKSQRANFLAMRIKHPENTLADLQQVRT